MNKSIADDNYQIELLKIDRAKEQGILEQVEYERLQQVADMDRSLILDFGMTPITEDIFNELPANQRFKDPATGKLYLRQEGGLTELEQLREVSEIEKINADITKIYNDISSGGVTDGLDMQKKLLEIQKLQQDVNKKQADEDQKSVDAGNEVDMLQLKIDDWGQMIGLKEGQTQQEKDDWNEAIENLVGTGPLGRFPITSRFTEKNKALVGTIAQLVSIETLDTLKNLKKSGATLGAISEKELAILQSAATKINRWEDKDENGIGKGTWNTSEDLFKAEIKRMRDSVIRLQDAALIDSSNRDESSDLFNF